jgi:ferredoxin, 2Fe-2S
MVNIQVELPDGEVRVIQVPRGHSLVAGMIAHHVGGLAADCGGTGICGTCHVQVDWLDAPVPPMAADEVELLAGLPTNVVTASSRMACRIEATPAIVGARVRIPAVAPATVRSQT